MEATRIFASLPIKQLSPDVVKSLSVYPTGSTTNLPSFLLPPTYEGSQVRNMFLYTVMCLSMWLKNSVSIEDCGMLNFE